MSPAAATCPRGGARPCPADEAPRDRALPMSRLQTGVDAIWPPRRSRVDLGEAFASAIASLRVAKLRSFLTVLGILIGVTTIVGMTSLVRGLDRSVTGSIESFGSTNLFLRKWG